MNVDPAASQLVADDRGRYLGCKADDPALPGAAVTHDDPWQRGQPAPQGRRQVVNAVSNHIQPPGQGVIDRGAQPELRGNVALPVLEPPGISPDLEIVG